MTTCFDIVTENDRKITTSLGWYPDLDSFDKDDTVLLLGIDSPEEAITIPFHSLDEIQEYIDKLRLLMAKAAMVELTKLSEKHGLYEL
jgi:hypothetical protein